MTSHSWVMVNENYDAVQCALCGTIRLTIHHPTQGTVIRYSPPNGSGSGYGDGYGDGDGDGDGSG